MPSHPTFDQFLQLPHRDRARLRPLVMGILNITPDSFSDGGRHLDPARAADTAARMLADGADLLDLGAESTRPGSLPVPPAEQIARLAPVLARLARDLPHAPLTLDTTRSEFVRAALDTGACVVGVNDVSAGRDDPAVLALAASENLAVILMHMQGTPQTMQLDPRYDDVVREVGDFLADRIDAATAAGVPRHRVLIDPGIGFGKTLEHNLDLLRHLPALTDRLGVPLLVGASRKGFLGKLTARPDPEDRLAASLAVAAHAAANGAAVLRVHDVAETADLLRVLAALE